MLDHINTRDTGKHLEAQHIMQETPCFNYLFRRDLYANDSATQSTLRNGLAHPLVKLGEGVEQFVDMVAIIGKQRRRSSVSRCPRRYIQRITPFRQA
jgi:hypothetical protein